MKKTTSSKFGDYLLAVALVLLLAVVMAGFFYWMFHDDRVPTTVHKQFAKDPWWLPEKQ